MDAIKTGDAGGERAEHGGAFHATQKRRDPIDGPRELGAKRLALQAQRRRQAVVDGHVSILVPDGCRVRCVLISEDGRVAFAISPTASGLFVEKRCCPAAGPRTSHAMLFENESIFDRWCDLDPIRFSDPLLADLLRRRGHEVFDAHG